MLNIRHLQDLDHSTLYKSVCKLCMYIYVYHMGVYHIYIMYILFVYTVVS